VHRFKKFRFFLTLKTQNMSKNIIFKFKQINHYYFSNNHKNYYLKGNFLSENVLKHLFCHPISPGGVKSNALNLDKWNKYYCHIVKGILVARIEFSDKKLAMQGSQDTSKISHLMKPSFSFKVSHSELIPFFC
jgi:hypothetical protein